MSYYYPYGVSDNLEDFGQDDYGPPMFSGTVSMVMPLESEEPRSNEIELDKKHYLIEGKCYEYAEATRVINRPYVEKRYYTENPLRYVGKFVKHITSGYEVYPKLHAYVFDLYGEEIIVDFSSRSCFREVSCRAPRLPVELSRDILTPRTQNSDYGLRQLERQRNALTTSLIADEFLHPSSISRASSRASSRARKGSRKGSRKGGSRKGGSRKNRKAHTKKKHF
jgi:hypothetical protein